MKSQSHRRNRDVSISGGIPHHQRRRVRTISQPGAERLTNVLRQDRQISGWSDPDHIDGCPASRISQPRIDEIQAEHAEQRVEQRIDNLGWLAATPDGGKSYDADQIVDARLEVFDLIGRPLRLRFHGQVTSAT